MSQMPNESRKTYGKDALVTQAEQAPLSTHTRQVVSAFITFIFLLTALDKLKHFNRIVPLTYSSTKTQSLTDLFVSYYVYIQYPRQ